MPKILIKAVICRSIDAVYLDNTYNHPSYKSFPAIPAVCKSAAKLVLRCPGQRCYIGDYYIGKEPLLMAIALACKERVLVEPRR